MRVSPTTALWPLLFCALSVCAGDAAPDEDLQALRRAILDDDRRGEALRKAARLGPAAAPVAQQVLCVLQQETPLAVSREEANNILDAQTALETMRMSAVPDLVAALGKACGSPIGLDDIGKPCQVSPEIVEDFEYCRWTRGLIGESLRLMGPDVVPALREALAKPGLQRLYVAVVLGQMGKEAADAAKELTWALTDGDPETRAAAARALGLIGPAARSAIPVLRVSLTDSDVRVRDAAAGALKAVESSPQ